MSSLLNDFPGSELSTRAVGQLLDLGREERVDDEDQRLRVLAEVKFFLATLSKLQPQQPGTVVTRVHQFWEIFCKNDASRISFF